MKRREGFVSNSSSSSFIIRLHPDVKTLEDFIKFPMHVDDEDWNTLYVKRRVTNYSGKCNEYNMFRVYEQIWNDIQNHFVTCDYAYEFGKDYLRNAKFYERYTLSNQLRQKLTDDGYGHSNVENIIKLLEEINSDEIECEMDNFCRNEDKSRYAIVNYSDNDGWWWTLMEHGEHWNIPVEIGAIIAISEH
jgi:hypothetical protein